MNFVIFQEESVRVAESPTIRLSVEDNTIKKIINKIYGHFSYRYNYLKEYFLLTSDGDLINIDSNILSNSELDIKLSVTDCMDIRKKRQTLVSRSDNLSSREKMFYGK